MASQRALEAAPLLAEGRSRPAPRASAASDDVPRRVGFDPSGDADNPLDWSPRFKWGIVLLLAFTSFTVCVLPGREPRARRQLTRARSTFNCMSVIPVARHIVEDLDGIVPPTSASVLPVTIWELGEAAGPLLIGPLSELTGRYPMINATNVLFILATALAALSNSTALFIASRALTGMAVASNVLNPAIVGDMFAPEQRGTAMSLIMFAPLLGGTVGPAMGGFLSETLGWRCVLWVSVVLAAVCEMAFFTCFRETYSVVILRRRAARLRSEVGSSCVTHAMADDAGLEKDSNSLRSSIMRPFAVLFGSGVLASLSLFGSIVFAQIYVLSVTLPGILEEIYGLSPAAVGSAFLAHGECGTRDGGECLG